MFASLTTAMQAIQPTDTLVELEDYENAALYFVRADARDMAAFKEHCVAKARGGRPFYIRCYTYNRESDQFEAQY